VATATSHRRLQLIDNHRWSILAPTARGGRRSSATSAASCLRGCDPLYSGHPWDVRKHGATVPALARA